MQRAISTTQHRNADSNAVPGNENAVRSQVCGGDKHIYTRGKTRPHSSHAEARFIEQLFMDGIATDGILTMSIDWPGGERKPGETRKSPCKDCKKLLCAATKCMTILICDPHDQPKPPKGCPKSK